MTVRVKILIGLIVVLGVGLRVWNYAGDPSLWFDEAALARPILELPFSRLWTDSLPSSQVAPRGFLLFEKLSTLLLGPSDRVLRLFPFVASIATLALVVFIAVRRLDPRAAVTATLATATAAPLILFACQVKQYSSDAAASALIVTMLCGDARRPLSWRGATLLAGVGCLTLWFSQSAVFVLAGAGIALLTPPRRAIERWSLWSPALVFVLVAWAGAALAVTVDGFHSMSPATREYMHRFWANGFMPLSVTEVVERRWPLDALTGIVGTHGQGLGFPYATLYAAIGALGGWLTWRKDRRFALLLGAPIGVAVAAAALQQYPFSGRLLVFLIPALLVLIAQGVSWIARQAERIGRWVGHVAQVLLLAPMLVPVLLRPPPYSIEDLRPVLAFVREHRQATDAVYVYYGAVPAFSVHGDFFGFSDGEFTAGQCHRGEPQRYLDELDHLRGRPRVWILMTHALPRYREREDILGYLDTIGRRRGSIEVPSRSVGSQFPSALAVLYDLSDPLRLAAASARDYRVVGPRTSADRYRCGEGPLAMPPSLLLRARSSQR